MPEQQKDSRESSPFFLNDRVYMIVKWVVIIVLPAIGTLYFGLAEIWHLPAPQQVLGTIIAIQAFLGVILGISSQQYNSSNTRYAGEINITDTPEKTLYSLDLTHNPEYINTKDEVTFKVNRPEAPSQ